MDYLLLSDLLWYSGHILSGISVLFTRHNFYLAVSFVFFGQMITILSRPISRINNNRIISQDECHDSNYTSIYKVGENDIESQITNPPSNIEKIERIE